ncbi:aspartic peptidase domain-containing protein [Xylaria sp. FL1777]|nr:aspartic peptidase domain-containing protein [Xylaria sp. FL1777]
MIPTMLQYLCLVLFVVPFHKGVTVGYEKPGLVSLPLRGRVTSTQIRRSIDRRDEDLYSPLSGNITSAIYYIQLYFGNPPNQAIEVAIATDYNDFWINPNCSAVKQQEQRAECEARGLYDPGKSSTAIDTQVNGSITYADGSWANFTYYTDQVTLLSGQGPSDVSFGVATNSSNNPSGILGLGLGAASKNGGERNFIDQLANQQFTNSKAFSLALGNGAADGQGVIIFGGVDTRKFAGKLISNDIIPPQGDDYARLARYYDDMDIALAPCAQRANNSQLQFTFGSATINVTFSELLHSNYNESMCYVGILPKDKSLSGTLGLNFLRSAYVVFDQSLNKISMQQYVNCGKNEQVIPGSGVDNFVGECNTTSSGDATPSETATPSADTPTATPSPDGGTSGLSTGGKAGVGVGVAVGVLSIIALLYFFLVRSRRGAAGQTAPPPPDTQNVGYQSPELQSSPLGLAHHLSSENGTHMYGQQVNAQMAEAPVSPQFLITAEDPQHWDALNKQSSPPATVVMADPHIPELEAQNSPTGYLITSSPAMTGGSEPRASNIY